jgi:DNA-binding beta-propeller fold protein YncE
LISRLAGILVLIVAFVAAALSPASGSAAERPLASRPLSRVRDVRLPGRPTRFDYQAVDLGPRRLYVAHLGDSSLDVVDLDTLRVVAIVRDINEIHGVAVAPELGVVFASATGADELVSIDSSTNRVTKRTPTGDFPDGVAVDRDDAMVAVSNKDDGSLTFVSASTGEGVDTLALGDEVGNVAYDQSSHLFYAATRPPDRLIAIDPTTRTISSRLRLSHCDGAHGVYIDPVAQRAFVACERNATLVTVDLVDRTVTGRFAVGAAPDVIAYDPELARLYVASESGTVTTFDTTGSRITKLGDQRVASSAHSVSVDRMTHRVFFPLEDVHGHPVLRVMQPSI